MDVTQSIRGGTKWLLMGSLSNKVFQFVFGIILARILIPEDFGIVVTIQVFTGMASLFASGGMGQALIRSNNVTESEFQAVFTVQLLIGLLIYFIFFFLATWMAEWFNNPVYELAMQVSAISFLMRPFLNIHNTWLSREMRFKGQTLVGLITFFFSNILSVSMALYGFGIWSLVISGLVGAFLSILLQSRLTPIRTRINFDFGTVKKFGLFGMKISANELVSYFRRQATNVIISRLDGASSVGIYNKADSLVNIPLETLSGSAYRTVFRSLSSHRENLDKSRYIYFKTITLLCVYSLPFYVALGWLAEPFILIVYGSKWQAVIQPLTILSLAGLFHCLGHPAGAVLAAQNLLGRELIVQIIALLLVVLGSIIGLKWGLTGVAWAIVATKAYASIHLTYLAATSLSAKFKDYIKAIISPLILIIIMISSLIITDYFFLNELKQTNMIYYLMLASVIGGGTYVCSFLLIPFKRLEPEAKRWKSFLFKYTHQVKNSI